MYKRSSQSWIKHIDFIVLDMLVLQLSFLLAYVIRIDTQLAYLNMDYRMLGLVMALVDVLVAAMLNTMHNVLKRGYYLEMLHTIQQAGIVFALMVLYLFSVKLSDTYSRIALFLTFGGHLFFGYCTRLLWKRVVRKYAKVRQKTSMILVADGSRVQEILEHSSPADEFEYKGLILTDGSPAGKTVCGLEVVSDLEHAADYICREWVDEVLIYPSHLHELEEDGCVAGLIEQCRQMSVPVHIRLPINNIGGKMFMEKVGGYNVLTQTTNYASTGALVLKRLLDICGSLVGCMIAFFVILIFGPVIKIKSPGPILFRQTRIGLHGRKFTLLKLRTMEVNSDRMKAQLMAQNTVKDGMMFKMDFDPRIIGNRIVDGKQVTGIGEFLRRTSLDEFPQFFCVLKGDMSLVGTRPPTVDEWEKYKYHHRARLATKPGITGLWQVSGRSNITDFEEVVRLDTEYINNWSIGLDLKILLKTVKVVLRRDGAK